MSFYLEPRVLKPRNEVAALIRENRALGLSYLESVSTRRPYTPVDGCDCAICEALRDTAEQEGA